MAYRYIARIRWLISETEIDIMNKYYCISRKTESVRYGDSGISRSICIIRKTETEHRETGDSGDRDRKRRDMKVAKGEMVRQETEIEDMCGMRDRDRRQTLGGGTPMTNPEPAHDTVPCPPVVDHRSKIKTTTFSDGLTLVSRSSPKQQQVSGCCYTSRMKVRKRRTPRCNTPTV